MSESLEETLAFLDEALRQSDFILNGEENCRDARKLVDSVEDHNGLAAKKKNPRHNKERHAEAQHLRNEVEDLKLLLQRLQTIRNMEHRAKETSGLRLISDGAELSPWRQTCVRQLEQRLRAEREKMHLTKNGEKLKKYMKSLKKLAGYETGTMEHGVS
ncbi:unnamed protein product [Phytophthora lilii]|uniref:Unnamed protein product n=1 Tax=Phytophthora lilii TaxID=2077276 RepID=A0A9W6U8L0_9STRA|nr:unnamed protein product [Phytophthora lilii]